jgi:hypothetical protein
MPHETNVVNLFYVLLSSTTLIAIIASIIFWYMISHGYKSIVIKFKKDTKISKEIKKFQKHNEVQYLDKLEKNLKKKKKKYD